MILTLILLDGNLDFIKDSMKKRFRDPKIVDDIVALDEEWRKSNSIGIL